MGASGSGLLFCLTRPEALRAEARMLHTVADWLDPLSDSDEDEPDRCERLGHAALHPFTPSLVGREGAQHPRFREARAGKHPHEPNVPPRVGSAMLH